MTQRYSRQIRLPGIGPAGQERIAAAQALVVGCGGLGAPVIQYLQSAGVGHLILIDDDRVELSNLNRQTLFCDADIGQQKAMCAARAVTNPDVKVSMHVERLTTDNALARIQQASIVIDCTDGLPSKYLLNDSCVVAGIHLVHGSVTASSGQMMVIDNQSACLRCAFPVLPKRGTVATCQSAGVLGATVGIVGSLMAQSALLYLAGTRDRGNKLYAIDLEGLSIRAMKTAKNPSCPVCGSVREIDGRDPYDYIA